jgi:hypothetical protein
MEYFIVEKGYDEEVMKRRNLLTSIRIGKVTDVLYENKPSDILPLKGSFPFVSDLDQATFLNRTMEHHLFKDLPSDIQLIVRKAEKAKWLHDRFHDYLSDKGIGKKEFRKKNPKTQQDILYDWLFSNKMDIGLLEI